MFLEEDFDLEYNSIANRNKHIFYFQYYHSDTEEFRDWIQYNFITPCDFKLLCDEYKKIYVVHSINRLIKKYKKDLMKFNRDPEYILDMIDVFKEFNINMTYYIRNYEAKTYYDLKSFDDMKESMERIFS